MKISGEDKIELLTKVLNVAFGVQKYLMPTVEVNKPKTETNIYALWHGHQCSLYGLSDRTRTNILISRSIDGQIIANAVEKLGMKTIRGSKGKRGSVEGTMQMISKLEQGENVAITVDGPNGPKEVVKMGVIKVAKLSGKPIIPYVWFTPYINFLKLPSWDSFTYPLGYAKMINLFGEPIYVDKDGTDEDDEKARLKVEQSLKELDKIAPQEWKKARKNKLWKKK